MATPFSRTTRALAHDSPQIALIFAGAAVVGLVAWLLWFTLSAVTVFEVSQHARLESGAAPRDISALQSGRLAVSRLQIGREVRAGEVLAELDSESEALQAAEEDARLAAYPSKTEDLQREIAALERAAIDDRHAADAAVQSARARVREAAAAADFASDNERRQRAQSATGGVAEIDALKAGAEARRAASARDALAADARKLDLDARTRAGQSEAQIQDLKRTLASLQSDAAAGAQTASRRKLEIENHRVRAPVDGIIAEALPVRPGAYVTEGQKLATVVPRGDLVIVAEFNPASALGRVKPGQHARLRLDGFPWTQYGVVEARVQNVSGEIRDGSLRVELLPSSRAIGGLALRHGLTGSAEVDIERVSPAVLLLRAAGQAVAAVGGAPAKPLAEAAR